MQKDYKGISGYASGSRIVCDLFQKIRSVEFYNRAAVMIKIQHDVIQADDLGHVGERGKGRMYIRAYPKYMTADGRSGKRMYPFLAWV